MAADYDEHFQRTLRAQGVHNDAALTLARRLYNLGGSAGSAALVEDPDDPGTYIQGSA